MVYINALARLTTILYERSASNIEGGVVASTASILSLIRSVDIQLG